MNIDDYVPKDNRGISKVDQAVASKAGRPLDVSMRNVEDFTDQELANYVMTFHRMWGQHERHNNNDLDAPQFYEERGIKMLNGPKQVAADYVERFRGRV